MLKKYYKKAPPQEIFLKLKKDGLYGKYIRGEVEPHSGLRKKMMAMKRENNSKYKKEIISRFDPLAFDSC